MRRCSLILFSWFAFGLRSFAQDSAPSVDGEPARGTPGSVRDEGSNKATEDLQRRIEKMVRAKLDRIVIPRLEFKDATIREAVEFLKRKMIELDPEPDPVKKGLGLVLKLDAGSSPPTAPPPEIPGLPSVPGGQTSPAEPRITVSLKNVAMTAALDQITSLANLKWTVGTHGVVIVPRNVKIDR